MRCIVYKKFLLMPVIAAICMPLCASAYAADPEPAAAPAANPAAPAPDAAAAKPAPAVSETTGTIYFFRPSKFVGAAIGFIVREGTTELGKLRNGKYFILHAKPGTHEYVVHSETKDVLTLEVEAGQTYYVEGTLGAGILAGRPNLSPSDQNTFDSLKSKLKQVEPMSDEKN